MKKLGKTRRLSLTKETLSNIAAAAVHRTTLRCHQSVGTFCVTLLIGQTCGYSCAGTCTGCVVTIEISCGCPATDGCSGNTCDSCGGTCYDYTCPGVCDDPTNGC